MANDFIAHKVEDNLQRDFFDNGLLVHCKRVGFINNYQTRRLGCAKSPTAQGPQSRGSTKNIKPVILVCVSSVEKIISLTKVTQHLHTYIRVCIFQTPTNIQDFNT